MLFSTTLTIRDAFIQGAENTSPFPNVLRSEGECFLCAQTSCLDSSLRSISQKLQDPCMENRLLESNTFSSASETSPKRAMADIQAVAQFLSKGLWPALCLHSHTPSWTSPQNLPQQGTRWVERLQGCLRGLISQNRDMTFLFNCQGDEDNGLWRKACGGRHSKAFYLYSADCW